MLQYKTLPSNLVRIKNLLEGYDNLTVMTTINAVEGLFELKFSGNNLDEVIKIMEGIKKEIFLEEVLHT